MVRERKREWLLWHYGASSIIQMAAVPLHLFSLLGLNIKMAAPKKDRFEKDETHTESKNWMCLTFHIFA